MTTTPLRPTAVDPLAGLDETGLALLAGAALRALPAHSPALFELVDAGLDRLSQQPLGGSVDDETLHASVRRLARCESRLTAEKLRRIDAVAQRESFRTDNERSAADWMAAQLGISTRQAHQQVRIAAAMRRLPAVADAFTAGDLGVEHAAAAQRGLAILDDLAHRRELDADGDAEALAAIAADAADAVAGLDAFIDRQPPTDPATLSKRIEAWTLTRHPASEQERAGRALRRRGLRWLPNRDADGLHTAIIKTTDTGKAQIDAALAPLARKTSAEDERSLVQRQHDALVTLSQQACDAGELPAVAAQRPHILMIGYRSGRDGSADAPPAWLDGVGPVGAETARLLACDAQTTDIVYDTDRGVWITGRGDGDPSPAQRKIVIARDVTCIGCGAAASRCQIHHIRYRSKQGRTVVENLVLVCWSCHQGLHHLGWTVTRAADGSFAISKRRAG